MPVQKSLETYWRHHVHSFFIISWIFLILPFFRTFLRIIIVPYFLSSFLSLLIILYFLFPSFFPSYILLILFHFFVPFFILFFLHYFPNVFFISSFVIVFYINPTYLFPSLIICFRHFLLHIILSSLFPSFTSFSVLFFLSYFCHLMHFFL